MIVEITQEDIDAAHAASRSGDYRPNCDCPTAQWARRVLGVERQYVGVSFAFVRLFGAIHFVLSRPMQNFIHAFDEGRPVQPARFRVRKVD